MRRGLCAVAMLVAVLGAGAAPAAAAGDGDVPCVILGYPWC